jgi:malate/lactate dehydrogenase
MPRAVAIVGLGRIGRMLAKLLLTYPQVEEQRLFSRSSQPGLFEEMRQANRHRQRIVTMDSPADLGQASHVFLCFSQDYSQLVHQREVADEWAVELEGNLAILRPLLPAWSRLEARTFIVYTNPVDIICSLLVRALPAGNQAFGFGSSLDSLRLRCLVGERGWMAGEHGVSMVPVGIGRQRAQLEAARAVVTASVRQVTIHQGYTILAPELATREFLDALCGESPTQLPLSAYDEGQGLCLGSLFHVSTWRIAPHPFSLNSAEAELWRESAAKIRADLERAKP